MLGTTAWPWVSAEMLTAAKDKLSSGADDASMQATVLSDWVSGWLASF